MEVGVWSERQRAVSQGIAQRNFRGAVMRVTRAVRR